MESEIKSRIPNLRPSDFDQYIFGSWKPETGSFYEKFHIERIERYKDHLNLPVLPHRRSVYFFLFVSHGWSVRSKGLTEFTIPENHFFCLPPDQITAISSISDDIEGFYCHFRADIFNHPLLQKDLCRQFDFWRISGNPLVKINSPELFKDQLLRLEMEYRKAEGNRFELIPLYLAGLFKEMELENPRQTSKPPSAAAQITGAYKDLLAEQIHMIHTVQMAAGQLGISPNHLNKSVRKITGKTAQNLLDEMKILEARVLLRQTAMPVQEIAAYLGKLDLSSFSRHFKKWTGISPKEYRKSSY